MIKATGLRIGNYIILDTGFAPPAPHIITAKDIFDIAEGLIPVRSLLGIKITHAILEKCGLGKYEDYNAQDGHDVWGIQVSNSTYLEFIIEPCIDAATNAASKYSHWSVCSEFGSLKPDIWNEPEYLHQLQNLYYCLSGEELIINL